MQIQELKDFVALYINNAVVLKLKQYLQQYREHPILHLHGLTGSLDALLIASLYRQSNRLQLVVLENYEEALAIYGDFQALLPDCSILLLPDCSESEEVATEHMQQMHNKRIAITRMLQVHENIAVVVTYLEALLHKVVNQSLVDDLSYQLAVGQTVSLQTLEEKLNQQQFIKTDFVYKQGQFAIRGGIVDIYTITESFPYRVELWGNNIASIRVFNPKDQKSFEERKHITILPNPGTIRQQPLTYASFATYLPEESCIWIQQGVLTKCPLDNLYEPDKAIVTVDQPFETVESLFASLASFPQIRFGSANAEAVNGAWVINYASEKQPSFKKDFNLLARDLSERNQHRYKVFITALVAGQLARLDTILQEKDGTTGFIPLLVGLREGYIDHTAKIICYTDHQIFNRYYRQQQPPAGYVPTEHLLQLSHFHIGDYVVHSDHGIGRFAGLHSLQLNGHKQEAMRLIYKNNDAIYVNVHELHKVSKYTGKEGAIPTIHTLGTASWKNKKHAVKKQIKEIAKDLIELYAKRKRTIGFAFAEDTLLDATLAASFPYEETPDQASAIAAVKADMEHPTPMDRLICGDVGFGKTEIAIRAAFKTAIQGKQVAVLVPTTILVLQHYNSFINRLADFPVLVGYINRFKTKQEIQQTIADTASGKIDILIGTHKLLSSRLKFKDLGLLIIDEEQKFGVRAKERIKQLHCKVDTLTLTATPIPRTLHLSLMGARDLSILTTPPLNRRPIQTRLCHFNLKIVKEAIQYEINRGGQVYFIHNKVSNIHLVSQNIAQLLPTVRIAVMHGQMVGAKLEETLWRFIAGHYDVLVSTRIVESGMDIPNANTILINDSHLLGLADLHQMRGRTGRSNLQSFCYLFIPENVQLTSEARLRLAALEEFSELGDGFRLAMKDLDIRGAGDLLGAAQSGFISDVGFDTYCKILEEAVTEVKRNDFKSLFDKEVTTIPSASECVIEVACEALFPSNYVQSVDQRILLYTRLNEIKSIDQLTLFKEELLDRFGPLPAAVTALLEIVPLRWEAQRMGFQKLSLKEEALYCYLGADFHKNNKKSWEAIFHYIRLHTHSCQLKKLDQNLVLIITTPVHSITEAKNLLITIGSAESSCDRVDGLGKTIKIALT